MPTSDTKIVPSENGFDIDVFNSLGLSLRVRGGVYVTGGFWSAPNATLALAASTTNYVEANDRGEISSNTSGFTDGSTQLYIVTTGGATITGVADCRSVNGLNGAADGVMVANNANANVVGSLQVVHRFDLAAGANADTDIVLTHKTRVIDAHLVLRGAGVASCVLTVKNTATAITNAMAASGSDQALVRATTIDDAAYDVAAGGTLRVTSSGGASQPACTVFVLGLRVA